VVVACIGLISTYRYSTLGPVSTWMGDHLRVYHLGM